MAAAEAQIARLDAVHEARMAEAKKRRDKAMEYLDPTENANVFWQVRGSQPPGSKKHWGGWFLGGPSGPERIRGQDISLSPPPHARRHRSTDRVALNSPPSSLPRAGLVHQP